MGLCTKLALIGLRDERGHQFAIGGRPFRGTAHRLMCQTLHRRAVEVSPVLTQFNDVEHRLERGYSNKRKERLRFTNLFQVCVKAILPVDYFSSKRRTLS